MTFSCTTKGSEMIKSVSTAINTLVEEPTFTVNSEGITFRGMDASHVALIDILCPSSSFDEYTCSEEMKFGVFALQFEKILKRAGKTDDISLVMLASNKMDVRIGQTKSFELNLLEPSTSDTPIPKIPYDSNFEILPHKLEDVLTDIEVMGDYLTIKINENGLEFFGDGDNGKAKVKLPKDDSNIRQIKNDIESTCAYSLEYLTPIIKAVGKSVESIFCEFSTAKPLKVTFNIEGSTIIFFLAPRVEN